MAYEYKEFSAFLAQNPLVTPAHFYVQIANLGNQDLVLLCNSVTLPGVSLMSAQDKIAGEYSELPTNPLYDPVTITFFDDNSMLARNTMVQWFNSVFDQTKRTVGFYDEFVKDVNIYLLNKKNEVIYSVVLKQAWPKTIQAGNLDYSQTNTPSHTSVTLSYKWWEQVAGGASGTAIQSSAINQLGSSSNLIGQLPIGSGLSPIVSQNLSSSSIPGIAIATQDAFEGSNNLFSAGMPIGLATGSSIITSGMRGVTSAIGGLNPISGAFNLPVIQQLAQPLAKVTNGLAMMNSVVTSLGIPSPLSRSINSINAAATLAANIPSAAAIPSILMTAGSAFGSSGTALRTAAQGIAAAQGVQNAIAAVGDSFSRASQGFTSVGTLF